MMKFSKVSIFGALVGILVFFVTATSGNSGLVLRVRLQDGTVARLQVAPGTENKLSLRDALRTIDSNVDNLVIESGASCIENPAETIQNLGLTNGSLITLKAASAAKRTPLTQKQPASTSESKAQKRWDPFPDLAKNYQSAIRRSKTRRAGAGSLSYADLAHIQSELHVVEPRAKGPLLRLYICPEAAERFQASGIQQKTKQINSRTGLLLGTFARERVDLKKPRKPRTSLSSPPSDDDFCMVAKVHAIWEPPSSTSSASNLHYDPKGLFGFTSESSAEPAAKAIKVAKWLGLEPVGWIFTYQEQRHSDDDDNLPVFCRDVQNGAKLQIENMQSVGREDGKRFVTVAMDAATGATEAFQLSDVSVQMVAEDMIVTEELAEKASGGSKRGKNQPTKGRFGITKHSILVDGQETNQLDSVLCLVNTAVLSEKGRLSGSKLTTKKNGALTTKSRKALLKKVDGGDSELLEELSSFHTLLALYDLVSSRDLQQLCELVRKWSRGQRNSTAVSSTLKKRLKAVLDVQ